MGLVFHSATFEFENPCNPFKLIYFQITSQILRVKTLTDGDMMVPLGHLFGKLIFFVAFLYNGA